MNTNFDLRKIIGHYGLETDTVAKVLYPGVRYPRQSLDRVLKGKSQLDTVQLAALADHIGVAVCELFNIDTWKGSTEDGCLVMIKGDYKAKLNYNGVYLTVTKGADIVVQSIANVPCMTVKAFIDYLDEIIKKYEQDGNL